jgi:hypothetical protein
LDLLEQFINCDSIMFEGKRWTAKCVPARHHACEGISAMPCMPAPMDVPCIDRKSSPRAWQRLLQCAVDLVNAGCPWKNCQT